MQPSVNTGNASNFCNVVWSAGSGGTPCCCFPGNTDDVVIEGGYTITLNINYTIRNITIRSGSTFIITGTGNNLSVNGNWTNNGNFIPGANTITLSATANAQTISGATTFFNLTLNNTFATVPQMLLASNIIVTNTLRLTRGIMSLAANDITVGTTTSTIRGITGYPAIGSTSTRYIMTGGTGKLIQKNLGFGGVTGAVFFPVGYNTTSYTPVVLNNSSGVADDFSVRISNGVYTSPPSTGIISGSCLNKTYNISEATPGGSMATIQIQWNTAEEQPGFSRASCAVSHYDSSMGYWEYTQLVGAATGAGPFYRTSPNNSSFSPYSAGSNGALPINLITFDAELSGKKVDLTWATGAEINNDYFTVEKSREGNMFENLARIKGAENSNKKIRYKITDSAPFEGTSYYRLKQTDYDGKFVYSNAVTIRMKRAENFEFNVFPNPSDGASVFLTAKNIGNNKELVVLLYDAFGSFVYSKVVFSDYNGELFTAIDSSEKLAPGVYFLIASSCDDSFRQKLVVH